MTTTSEPSVAAARRIEQASGNKPTYHYGTIYPALMKLELKGYVAAEMDAPDRSLKAKSSELTSASSKRLALGPAEWVQTTANLARSFAPQQES